MMYEGLVKSLRYCATHDCCGEGEREAGCAAPYSLRKDCDTCNQVLQAQAADAIEKLSQIVREYQKFDGFLAAHGMFKQDPMVPLPEPPKEEET